MARRSNFVKHNQSNFTDLVVIAAMDAPGQRLRQARIRAGFKTATAAARAFNWPIPTYLGHENGDRVPSRPRAKRYAEAFGVRWEWILEGNVTDQAGRAAAVLEAGFVGPGTQVLPMRADHPPSGPHWSPAEQMHALIVKGNALHPRYFDGERLLYRRDGTEPSELLGKECVLRLEDGRMLVRILRPGSKPDRFHLESWCAPLMEDQAVAWASQVKWRCPPAENK